MLYYLFIVVIMTNTRRDAQERARAPPYYLNAHLFLSLAIRHVLSELDGAIYI